MNRLIIIGAGGHGGVVADIASLCGYEDIAFMDDNKSILSCAGYPVIGISGDAADYRDADFFVAIGDAGIREEMLMRLHCANVNVARLIHPHATIARGVVVGTGTVVMAGAVVNPGAQIGEGCIINTGATVGHDNQIADYVHVSAGCHLAGTVSVGKSTWIGIGAVVSNNLSICGGCMIGAGAVVVRDIDTPGTYVGVPARKKTGSTEGMRYTGGGVLELLIMVSLLPPMERWRRDA